MNLTLGEVEGAGGVRHGKGALQYQAVAVSGLCLQKKGLQIRRKEIPSPVNLRRVRAQTGLQLMFPQHAQSQLTKTTLGNCVCLACALASLHSGLFALKIGNFRV